MIEWLIPIVTLLLGGGGVLGYLKLRPENRNTEATADQTLEGIRGSVFEMVQQGTERLKLDLAQAQEEIRELKALVEELTLQTNDNHLSRLLESSELEKDYWKRRAERAETWLTEAGMFDRRSVEQPPPDGTYKRNSDRIDLDKDA